MAISNSRLVEDRGRQGGRERGIHNLSWKAGELYKMMEAAKDGLAGQLSI